MTEEADAVYLIGTLAIKLIADATLVYPFAVKLHVAKPQKTFGPHGLHRAARTLTLASINYVYKIDVAIVVLVVWREIYRLVHGRAGIFE